MCVFLGFAAAHPSRSLGGEGGYLLPPLSALDISLYTVNRTEYPIPQLNYCCIYRHNENNSTDNNLNHTGKPQRRRRQQQQQWHPTPPYLTDSAGCWHLSCTRLYSVYILCTLRSCVKSSPSLVAYSTWYVLLRFRFRSTLWFHPHFPSNTQLSETTNQREQCRDRRQNPL